MINKKSQFSIYERPNKRIKYFKKKPARVDDVGNMYSVEEVYYDDGSMEVFSFRIDKSQAMTCKELDDLANSLIHENNF